MRLTIDHRTVHRLPAPQARLIQLLRLTPEDTETQSVAHWDVHPDCDARIRRGRDGFGNRTTMLYVAGPVEAIEIIVTGEVLTTSGGGVVRGTSEPFPPALFLRSTALTPIDDALADWARCVAGSEGDACAALHRLTAAIHRDGAGDVHRLIVATRSLGLPARYVSGYSAALLDDPGRAAPHAWVEAHVDGLGWVAVDPATGLPADEAYVRVAVGLDAAGTEKLAGPGSPGDE